jgi:hypothetical protein
MFLFFIRLVFFSPPRMPFGRKTQYKSLASHMSLVGDSREYTQLVSETILTISVAWMIFLLFPPFTLKNYGAYFTFSSLRPNEWRMEQKAIEVSKWQTWRTRIRRQQ